MASKYSGLALGMIDEGRFEKEIDETMKEAAKKLLAHRKKYGNEQTRGAKCTVTVKIVIASDKKSDGVFAVMGDIKETVPSRPPVVNLAIEENEQDNTPGLFMRKSGGTQDTPRQTVLATKDGAVVDLETGEVRGKRAAAGE